MKIDNIINLCKSIVHSKNINVELIKAVIQNNQNDIAKAIKLLNQYKITQCVYYYAGTDIVKLFPEFYQILNNSYQKRFDRSQYQLSETQRVATAFAKHKIPLIAYKGMPFARQFYQTIKLRNSVDVDFAISKQHLSKIGEIMISLGYREAKGINNYQNLQKTRGYYIDYSWLLYNENNKPICNVEFHWRVTATALYVPLLFDDVFDKQAIIEIQNQAVRTFQPVYQALLILIHHSIVDGWGKLRHLIDLTQIDKTLNAQEWENLIQLTVKYKVYNAFMVGCHICSKLFNYEFRNQVNTKQVEQLGFKMIAKIKEDKLSRKWSQQPVKLVYYLKMRDNWQDFFKSVLLFIQYSFKEIVFKIRRFLL